MSPPAAAAVATREETRAYSSTLHVLPVDSPDRAARERACDQCGEQSFRHVLSKASEQGETFHVLRCQHCGLVQVNPRPPAERLAELYGEQYFGQRTERGYDNYFSEAVRRSIHATLEKNLNDLHFAEFETLAMGDAWISRACAEFENAPPIDAAPRALDIGCAAGYFVDYLQRRGWQAEGVEISGPAARFGREQLGLNILHDDFMTSAALRRESYDLVSLWASIEHLPSPRAAMLRAVELLKPGGRMLLSTCRHGLLARALGPRWRYLNVPEHLFYFSKSGLRDLAESVGFDLLYSISYGSGLTARKNASIVYRLGKAAADWLVKQTDQGDMMAFHLIKR